MLLGLRTLGLHVRHGQRLQGLRPISNCGPESCYTRNVFREDHFPQQVTPPEVVMAVSGGSGVQSCWPLGLLAVRIGLIKRSFKQADGTKNR